MENPNMTPWPQADVHADLLARFDKACSRQPGPDPKRCRSEACREFSAEEVECIKALWFARQAEQQRHLEEQREAEEQRGRQERLQHFMAGVGPRLAYASLDGFVMHGQPHHREAQRRALEIVGNYLAHLEENLRTGRGLWLRGTCGVGKDFLAVALAKEMIRQHGLTVGRVTGAELFRRMRHAMHNDTEGELLADLTRPKVLVLSDPAPVVGEMTAFQAQTLYEVVDTRNAQCRPTWTTINATDNAEADRRLTPPVADRLRHDAIEIECVWPSWRTEVEDKPEPPLPAARPESSDPLPQIFHADGSITHE